MNQKVNHKKQNRIRIMIFTMVAVLMLVTIAYGAYNVSELVKNPTELYLVSNGSISQEESVKGIIIREEYVLKGENYKNGLEPIKTEGEKVAKGDFVFSYHSKNEEELKKKIDELDAKINEAMEKESSNILSADIKLIEKQVESKLDNVYNSNELQKISEYKKDINTSINKKARIAGDLSPSGSYIKGLIDERTSYANELNSGIEVVNATESGMVSYRVDELEELLKPGDFSYLTLDLLNRIDIKPGQVISTGDEKGKIINNFVTYIAVVMDSQTSKEVNIGKRVLLRLSNTNEISAKIAYISEQPDNQRIIVFQTGNSSEFLLNYRKISLDVMWKKETGLKIPNSGLRYDGELTYITRSRAGYTDEILVKVVEKNETYSIIENYDTDELKEIGFTLDEISKRKTIALYDEIIIKK